MDRAADLISVFTGSFFSLHKLRHALRLVILLAEMCVRIVRHLCAPYEAAGASVVRLRKNSS